MASPAASITNVANPADGSDGSVVGTAGTVVMVPPAHVPSSLADPGPDWVIPVVSTRVSSVGTRAGPSLYNSNFVKSPTGDIGLTSTGPPSVVSVTISLGCADFSVACGESSSLVTSLSPSLSVATVALSSDAVTVAACWIWWGCSLPVLDKEYSYYWSSESGYL